LILAQNERWRRG